MPEVTTLPTKLAYRIKEAASVSGLSRSNLYNQIREGALRSIKVGGRRLILREDLLRFLGSKDAAAGSGR